jgi:hypothetical protein
MLIKMWRNRNTSRSQEEYNGHGYDSPVGVPNNVASPDDDTVTKYGLENTWLVKL